MSWLRIQHATTYRHAAPAAVAWQTLRLHPRDEDGQECRHFQLDVNPQPGDITQAADYLGNITHQFTLREPHTELSIHTESVVRRRALELPDPEKTPPLEQAAIETREAILGGSFDLEQFLHPSRFVPDLPATRALTADCPVASTPILAWIEALGARFAGDFAFDPTATDISTPLAQVFETRRGVCQDFAHLFIAAARTHGLAAAYVSGYILTHPPPDQPRLRGADAMHAWASIHVPAIGWLDFDPTNNVFAGAGHIVVARGRDYADVSPIRGVFNGGGEHTLYLGVTVEPEEVVET